MTRKDFLGSFDAFNLRFRMKFSSFWLMQLFRQRKLTDPIEEVVFSLMRSSFSELLGQQDGVFSL